MHADKMVASIFMGEKFVRAVLHQALEHGLPLVLGTKKIVMHFPDV